MPQIPTSVISDVIKKNFCIRIRKLREEIGVTQADFAQAMGVSRAAIGYYESGDRVPDITFLATVSFNTGCSLDYLLGFSEEKIHIPLTLAEEKKINDAATFGLKELLEYQTFLLFISDPQTRDFFYSFDAISILAAFGIGKESGDIVAYKVASSLGSIFSQCYLEIARKHPKLQSDEMQKLIREADSVFKRSTEIFRNIKEKLDLEKKTDEAVEQIQDPIERYKAKLITHKQRLYGQTI